MSPTGPYGAPPLIPHRHTAMDHTTDIDITALEAEIAAIEAEDAAQSARVGALLATGSAAARLADCRVMAEQLEHDSRVQARYQRRITRAMQAP